MYRSWSSCSTPELWWSMCCTVWSFVSMLPHLSRRATSFGPFVMEGRTAHLSKDRILHGVVDRQGAGCGGGCHTAAGLAKRAVSPSGRSDQAAGLTKRPVSPSGRGLSCGGAGLLGPALITEYILGSPIFRGCYAGKECGTCGGAYGRRAAVIQGACDRMG